MTSKPSSVFTKVSQEELDKIFNNFKELGCCDYCCLRFTGVNDSKSYVNYKKEKCDGDEKNNENGAGTKMLKTNPCLTCIGILQSTFCDDIIEKIYEKILKEGYKSDTFNIAITLPISYQIRAQSMWYYIIEKYPNYFKTLFQFGYVTISPKDVIKWLATPKLEYKTTMKFDPKSDFCINVFIEYKDDCKECMGLFKLFPDTFKNRKKGLSNISRKSVDDLFNNKLCEDDFREEYPCPPSIPDNFATLESITFAHNSVFVAGRYCKYSRQLPQTPWIVGNERKMVSSLQEKITIPIEKAFKTKVSKFGASGREDVDVRMLGRGRPFTVELINPKRTKLSYQLCREIENEINSSADGDVTVRDIQVVPKSSLIDLKSGEEDKCKLYSALCAISKGYFEKLVETVKLTPLELDQSTPIRVLHRRPVASRKRTIHSLAIHKSSAESPVDGTELCIVELKTQAGTYVKEFIHGDLGRTKPSLKSLTQAPFIDILALDVKDIELDWPPPINYNETPK